VREGGLGRPRPGTLRGWSFRKPLTDRSSARDHNEQRGSANDQRFTSRIATQITFVAVADSLQGRRVNACVCSVARIALRGFVLHCWLSRSRSKVASSPQLRSAMPFDVLFHALRISRHCDPHIPRARLRPTTRRTRELRMAIPLLVLVSLLLIFFHVAILMAAV